MSTERSRGMSRPTGKQQLGRLGERAVSQHVSCPRCSGPRHLSPLPVNFQCADLICKFCGYLAQVKAISLPAESTDRPRWVLGAAWGPQQAQLIAGIFHGLYLVGYSPARTLVRIDYVPATYYKRAQKSTYRERRCPARPSAPGGRGSSTTLTSCRRSALSACFLTRRNGASARWSLRLVLHRHPVHPHRLPSLSVVFHDFADPSLGINDEVTVGPGAALLSRPLLSARRPRLRLP
jgi:hypothetical protein